MSRAERRCGKPYSVIIFIFGFAIMGASLAGSFVVQADTLNIFAPFWVGILIVTGVMLACKSRRSRPAAYIMLVASMVLGSFLMWPLYSAQASVKSRGQGHLRIVSFNIYKDNPDIRAAVTWIIQQDADVVVLLEAGYAKGDTVSRLKAHFPNVYSCRAGDRCSTVILSRRPAQEVWPLGAGDPDRRLGLSAVTARFEVSGQAVPVTAVHLDRPWPIGDQAAFGAELEMAVATVGRGGVLLGDFNSAPWTFAMRRLAEAGDLRLASGLIGTWPAASPLGNLRLPLDQVYLGSCLASVAVFRGPDLHSDHLPLVTDVATGACVG